MIYFLAVTLFPALMIFAGAGDALALRIPNWLVLLVVASFVPMAALTGMPLNQVGLHCTVAIALFVIGYVLFELGAFGGGDAKLLAAAGLWLGWPDVVPFLVATVFAGAVLALVVGIWSMLSINSEVKDGKLFRRFSSIRPNVPYGYALAIGAILAFPDSWWMPIAGKF